MACRGAGSRRCYCASAVQQPMAKCSALAKMRAMRWPEGACRGEEHKEMVNGQRNRDL